MSEIIVRTKNDFERVKKELPDKIIFEGEMAKGIKKALKAKKIRKGVAIGGGVLGIGELIAGVILAPVTGGLSLVGAAPASLAAAIAFGGTTIVLTTAEVAIIAGVVAFAIGIAASVINDVLKNYEECEVKNGRVVLRRKQTTEK